MSDFKVDNAKERLLCYSAAILTARISNPNNTYGVEALLPSSVKYASKLIEGIYNESQLAGWLK